MKPLGHLEVQKFYIGNYVYQKETIFFYNEILQ